MRSATLSWPVVRVVGLLAVDAYLAAEWFARLSIASTYSRFVWMGRN